jgi:O-antigen/teichoic acid export membrane protein
VLGARTLSAADLGALATVLAIVAIASVPGMGLQIAVAVQRAKHPGSTARHVGWITAGVCAGLVALLTPVAGPLFDLPSQVMLLLAVYTGAIVVAGRWLGQVQGDERFLRLALGMAVLAAGRYGGLVAGLLLGAGLTGSVLIGTLVSLLIPVALTVVARVPGAAPGDRGVSPRHVVTACSATLAMLVVSYADLLLARALLPADASGAYAVGTVLTKGAMWAPQVVTVLALPRLAQGSMRALAVSIGLVTGSGTLLIAMSALAGGLAFRAAGGAGYVGLGRYAPVFALTGALYALVFVLVNAQVAAGAKWPSAPLWASTAVLVAAAWLVPHTFAAIMWCAAGTATLALVATAYLTYNGGRRSRVRAATSSGTHAAGTS